MDVEYGDPITPDARPVTRLTAAWRILDTIGPQENRVTFTLAGCVHYDVNAPAIGP